MSIGALEEIRIKLLSKQQAEAQAAGRELPRPVCHALRTHDPAFEQGMAQAEKPVDRPTLSTRRAGMRYLKKCSKGHDLRRQPRYQGIIFEVQAVPAIPI